MPHLFEHFTQPLLQWYVQHGRKDLPWKFPLEPYRVWLSEIMLQQTQVKTVIPYFLRFIDRFPDIHSLAQASQDEVLALWSGLGYYSRGRNLHQTAQIILHQYQGKFPTNRHELMQLPGIGASTAAAITSQAFNQPTAILDGNVKRVLSRYFLVEGVSSQTTNVLWGLADKCMSQDSPAEYTQAIMDLGATCCTLIKPQCTRCPVQNTCKANLQHVTAYYPSKKIPRIIPHKTQQFLMMHSFIPALNEIYIYLEKRPAKGIWGGLWCPPHINDELNPHTYIKKHYAEFKIMNIHPLLNIQHSFTHLKLLMKGLAVEIMDPGLSCVTNHRGWFSLPETIKLGLAKPISHLIESLHSWKGAP